MSHARRFAWISALALIAWTAGPAEAGKPPTEAIQARIEIPEAELLDVGIELFDPGLPPGDVTVLEEEGIFADVRKSEARYAAVMLMETLQATGHWGAVRVVPEGASSVDVLVSGTIAESNGHKMIVEIEARDARRRPWLAKRYKEIADPQAYRTDEGAAAFVGDPFQNLYNRVANDLLAARGKLRSEDLREVRRVAELRFAADLAPSVFDDYLRRDRKGRLAATKLPADGDPMIARIARIRERDEMFVDTLNERYAAFHAQMGGSYDSWRAFSYEEELARIQLKRQARTRKILGALAILGAVATQGGGQAGSAARDIAFVGGLAAIQSGVGKGKEAKLHIEALRELAASFDSEIAPLLVDVEGQTMRLSGSAETQFVSWRKLLRELFATETGLPVDLNTGEQVAAEPGAAVTEGGPES